MAVVKLARLAARTDDRGAPRRTSNVVAPLSRFVGREADLEAIDRAFADGARIVTVLGPGGMGKTRLLYRFAEQQRRSGGVWFVDLTTARDVFDVCVANGAFNLILHLDENANNDLARAMTNDDAVIRATPDKGELVKRISLDVSCHAPSPCVDVTLDCADGTSCTKIAPIKSWEAKTPGCPSDDAFCM